jgi:hypothetical protein
VDLVVAGAGVDRVDGAATVDDVVAGPGDDGVGRRARVQLVVAVAAVERVMAEAAERRVGARLARERVAARAAVEEVVAAATRQRVVARLTVELVRTRGANDAVAAAARPHDLAGGGLDRHPVGARRTRERPRIGGGGEDQGEEDHRAEDLRESAREKGHALEIGTMRRRLERASSSVRPLACVSADRLGSLHRGSRTGHPRGIGHRGRAGVRAGHGLGGGTDRRL